MGLLINPFINPTPLLDDDFNDNSRDTSKWNLGSIALEVNTVGVAETNNRLEITPLTGTGTASFYGYASVNTFDVTQNRVATVQIVEALATNHEAWLVVGLDASNYVRIAVTGGGSLITRYRTGAANTNTTHRAYSHSTDAYLRIAYDNATSEFVFYVSGDGITYTELRRQDPSWATTALRGYLTGGNAASLGSATPIKFDNFMWR